MFWKIMDPNSVITPTENIQVEPSIPTKISTNKKFRLPKIFRSHKGAVIALLGTLIVIGGLFAATLLSQNDQDLRQKASETTGTGVKLKLIPDKRTVNPGDEIKIAVNLDTNNLEVTAVSLKLNFDNTKVAPIRIEKADAMNDVLAAGQTTSSNATITLGSGLNAAVTGQKNIAFLYVTAADQFGDFTITIDPSTMIAAKNHTGTVGDIFENTTITSEDPNAVDPTPTPSPTPSPTPDDSTNPTPTPNPDDDTDPTPTPTPTPTPSPTPDPGDDNACNKPNSPTEVSAQTGQKSGEITVTWRKPGSQKHFAIGYGTKSGTYSFGATDIGNVSSYTIKSLSPNTRYYIVLAAVNDCGSSPFSSEKSAVAQKSSQLAGTNPTPTPRPTPTPAIATPKPTSTPKTTDKTAPTPKTLAGTPKPMTKFNVPVAPENEDQETQTENSSFFARIIEFFKNLFNKQDKE